jgi:NAD+ synthase
MNKISKWIKKYAEKNRINSLVVGVSGGIDSAVVSTLCCQTGITTYIISMPIYQKDDQLNRARLHSKWLCDNYKNASFLEIDLTDTFENFTHLFDNNFKTSLALANTRSRLRMVTLYQISGSINGIVVGTGNKIEDFGVGFFTKYGDGGVDISPIADLTKTEVRELASELGISKSIIEAKPTDGLWEDDRSDEDQIGASYEELEWAMNFKDNGEIITDYEMKILEIYKKFNLSNRHKMRKIPIFKNRKK